MAFVTRRRLLTTAMSGAAVSLARPIPAQTRGVGAIDVHHHLLPPAYLAANGAMVRATVKGFESALAWTPDTSLRALDEARAAGAVLSLSAPVWTGDVARGRELTRISNDYGAELVARYPRRFGFYAILPLPDGRGQPRRDRARFRPAALRRRDRGQQLRRPSSRRSGVRPGAARAEPAPCGGLRPPDRQPVLHDPGRRPVARGARVPDRHDPHDRRPDDQRSSGRMPRHPLHLLPRWRRSARLGGSAADVDARATRAARQARGRVRRRARPAVLRHRQHGQPRELRGLERARPCQSDPVRHRLSLGPVAAQQEALRAVASPAAFESATRTNPLRLFPRFAA